MDYIKMNFPEMWAELIAYGAPDIDLESIYTEMQILATGNPTVDESICINEEVKEWITAAE